MSTVKANSHQVGQSATAANNFTLYQPSTPDGTVRLGVGNAGATTADVITASSTGVTIPSVSSSNTFGFKNRIINGGMVIDQRNAGASVTPTVNQTYIVDRWKAWLNVSSKFSVQQNAGSITPPAGFINYLGVTSLSSYSIASSEFTALGQSIEGLNCADLAWGTASAKTVTLSFQVYSSLTGTFGGSLCNNAGSRSYPFTYSITSSNTWTSVSVQIPGDTSGTWLKDNSTGINLFLSLGAGSTWTGAAGSWAGAYYLNATGATSVVGTNGATFYITGVQLEVGSQATSFDFRSYGQELALCQRYYYKGSLSGGGCTNSTSASYPAVAYPTQMRTAPTIGWVSGGKIGNGVTDTPITGLGGTIGVGETNAAIQVSHGPAFTAGNGIVMYNTPVFSLSSEL